MDERQEPPGRAGESERGTEWVQRLRHEADDQDGEQASEGDGLVLRGPIKIRTHPPIHLGTFPGLDEARRTGSRHAGQKREGELGRAEGAPTWRAGAIVVNPGLQTAPDRLKFFLAFLWFRVAFLALFAVKPFQN